MHNFNKVTKRCVTNITTDTSFLLNFNLYNGYIHLLYSSYYQSLLLHKHKYNEYNHTYNILVTKNLHNFHSKVLHLPMLLR